MVERVNGYRVGEVMYATRKEAEAAEGRAELIAWLDSALERDEGEGVTTAEVLADHILNDSGAFVAILRLAGAKTVNRKPETKPRKPRKPKASKEPVAIAAE